MALVEDTAARASAARATERAAYSVPNAQMSEEGARAVLRVNDRGTYTVPHAQMYPFQWNWDSALISIGLATFDCDRALLELETLFQKGQWDDGMVPGIVFHVPTNGAFSGPAVWLGGWGTNRVPPTTGISQPPLVATAVRFIWERVDATGAAQDKLLEQRVRRLVPRVMAWHRWWHEVRDPDRSGLTVSVHPWETGRDALPDWEEPMRRVPIIVDVAHLRKDLLRVTSAQRLTHDAYNRYISLVEEAKALQWAGPAVARRLSFRVCDVGIQAILLRADRDLLALANALNLKDEAAQIEEWIARGTAAFARLKHDDGTFRSLDLRTNRLSPHVNAGTFLSLYARTATKEEAAQHAELFWKWMEVALYAVPAIDPRSPLYRPHESTDCAGPVSPVLNRLIADGFAWYGYTDIAETIRKSTLRLLSFGGPRESFDSRTGAGLGADAFSYSAAVWLSWANDPHPLTGWRSAHPVER